jgi:hypothetical protein
MILLTNREARYDSAPEEFALPWERKCLRVLSCGMLFRRSRVDVSCEVFKVMFRCFACDAKTLCPGGSERTGYHICAQCQGGTCKVLLLPPLQRRCDRRRTPIASMQNVSICDMPHMRYQ